MGLQMQGSPLTQTKRDIPEEMIYAPKIKKSKKFMCWKKRALSLPLHKPYFRAYEEEKFVLLTPCKSSSDGDQSVVAMNSPFAKLLLTVHY